MADLTTMKAPLRLALACLAILAGSVLLFFALYGALSIYAGPPLPNLRPKSPSDFAGWIQAVGSIMAILGSYFIGARQANQAHESAMALYTRQRNDRDAKENARLAQAKTDSLVTIAGTVAIVRRLHLETVDLARQVDNAAVRLDKAVRKYDDAITSLENKRVNPGARWFDTAEEDQVELTGNEAKAARTALASFLEPIDDLLSRLSQLPRHEISIARPELATIVVQAIDGLNRAAIEIEHAPTRAKVTAWMRTAEQALDSFGRSFLDENTDELGTSVSNENGSAS